MSDRVEIRDYEIEFSDEKEVDVPDLQATLIIKAVLDSLNVSFDEIKIKSKNIVFDSSIVNDEGISFPRGEPEYWSVTANPTDKLVEVTINEYIIGIPLNRILFWFAQEEEKDER